MAEEAPRDLPHVSQIETNAPKRRVVMLGASNLSIMFPTVVETARALFATPLELFVAKGFGRSYGQESKFFGKKFSGILQSGLWDAMRRARPLPTFALLSDVGNDLAYEAPVERVVTWIEQTLDRLAAYDAKVVLNNIPIASLKSVGSVRYQVFREVLFPNCRLPRAEMFRRAEQLDEALVRIASERDLPIFSGELAWYGLDPIHPRWSSRGEIWRRMFSALRGADDAIELVRPTPQAALQLRRLKAHRWSQFGWPRRAEQPSGRLADGGSIAIF